MLDLADLVVHTFPQIVLFFHCFVETSTIDDDELDNRDCLRLEVSLADSFLRAEFFRVLQQQLGGYSFPCNLGGALDSCMLMSTQLCV